MRSSSWFCNIKAVAHLSRRSNARRCAIYFQCSSSFSTEMSDISPRVLSIQSHVVSGYVGNKSATFPLQVLGFEVDAINSVQFSNHTGYKHWKGQVLAEPELVDLIDGLAQNDLDCGYTHFLTGYNRSKSFLDHIAKIVSQLREKNPGLIYLCDPVIGDIGRGVYVPPELVEVYRDTVIPLANIVTPNQFELEILSGKEIRHTADVWDAIEILHDKGPQTVVISSAELGSQDTLCSFVSTKVAGKNERVTLTYPRLEGSYTGTGDLFSSLFMAWMWHSKQNVKQSLENTVATIQAIIQRTITLQKGNLESARARELKLIQGKKDIENPTVVYHASSVHS